MPGTTEAARTSARILTSTRRRNPTRPSRRAVYYMSAHPTEHVVALVAAGATCDGHPVRGQASSPKRARQVHHQSRHGEGSGRRHRHDRRVSDYQCPGCTRAQPVLARCWRSSRAGPPRLQGFPPATFTRAPSPPPWPHGAPRARPLLGVSRLSVITQPAFARDDLLLYAGQARPPAEAFAGCLDAGRIVPPSPATCGRPRGRRAGTPTFFVNGRRIVGVQPIPVSRGGAGCVGPTERKPDASRPDQPIDPLSEVTRTIRLPVLSPWSRPDQGARREFEPSSDVLLESRAARQEMKARQRAPRAAGGRRSP